MPSQRESSQSSTFENIQRTERLTEGYANEIFACQISTWYSIFSKLTKPNDWDSDNLFRSNVTLRSVILDLPNSFYDYLLEDGLFIPDGAKLSSVLLQDSDDRQVASKGQQHEKGDDWSTSSSSSSAINIENGERDESKEGPTNVQKYRCKDLSKKKKVHSFLELNQQIEDAIESLYANYVINDDSDKAVFPKLNWSAPKDAVWVNNGSAKCCTAGDVYMILKASDFCSYDVNHALPDLQESFRKNNKDKNIDQVTEIPKLQLCLRKWCYLYPSQEFRCFVRDQSLIAISQRHETQHWPHLTEKQVQEEYQQLIIEFHETIIQPNLQNHPPLSCLRNYAMDVYIDKKKKVWLIDFNVWSSRTDALLFTWTELEQLRLPPLSDISSTNVMLRVVETGKQVRADPLSCYKAPIDTLYMASNSAKAPNSDERLSGTQDTAVPSAFESKGAFEQFIELCQRPSAASSDCSDEDDDGSGSRSG